MTAYHTRFRNFHVVTLDATRKLIKGWASLDEDTKLHRMNRWLDRVSAVYGVEKPLLTVDSRVGHDGMFNADWWRIDMPRLSIITLLHEFRHAMQFAGVVGRNYDDPEEDARSWSLSLYATIAPVGLRRLVYEGAVLHLTAADLAEHGGYR